MNNASNPVPLTSRVRVAPDVLVSELDGGAVLLDLKSECYFGLDGVGTIMWTALTTAPTFQAAYEDLLSQFEVSEDELRRDLIELVGKLSAQGLVVITGA